MSMYCASICTRIVYNNFIAAVETVVENVHEIGNIVR